LTFVLRLRILTLACIHTIILGSPLRTASHGREAARGGSRASRGKEKS
jgi:hypothetical protein